MHFLAPAFLLGALAAALPVALHLMGRRPELRVLFPAVRLLKRSPAQETRRRRLRDLVLLALRVSAIALLAVAFARPYFAQAVAPSRADVVVVAVDRSFSMSAPGQFARALSRARSAISRAPAGASVGLLAFDDEVAVLAKPSPDRGAAMAALDRLQPGFGSTSYSTALGRAADAIGSARGRVVVITDLQRSGWDRRDVAIPNRIDVVVEDVGGPTSNLAVSSVRPVTDAISAVIRDSGNISRTGRARLMVDGQVRGVVAFSVDAGAARQITFPIRVPAKGTASVEIDDPVGYQADNKAYALLDAPQPPALLAITGDGDSSRGAFYLERALGVDNGSLFRLDTEPAARFSTTRASVQALEPYSAVVLLGTRGLTRAAVQAIADYVTRGGGVLLALDDRVEAPSLDALFGTRLVVTFEGGPRSNGIGLLAADTRHPVLQSFDPDAFAAVRFDRVPRVQLPAATVLARFANGEPAILEQHRGAGRVLVFGSDLSNRWNDLPLQPAFLPLVHQIARYLAGGRLPEREFLVSSVPPGVDRRPGVAVLHASEDATRGRSIVVNVDPRESDVARMTAAEFGQVIARRRGSATARSADVRQTEQQQSLWRLAIAMAVAALLFEGMLGKRLRA